MTIRDILNQNEITISFEVFPPKTDASFNSVAAAAEDIAKLHPHFMSVTYGAGGSNSHNTLGIADKIQNRFNTPVLAHLTCVSSTRDRVKEIVNTYKSRGICNIMALRGDIPEGGREQNDFEYASDLIKYLKDLDNSLCIGGACYPEGHIECARQSEDIQHLKEKVDAGCDFLTTQMFFDNQLLYQFMYRIREIGIKVPILPGIMPITNEKLVARSVALSGSTVPQRFRNMVDRYGSNPEMMKQAGIVYASEQIIDLIANRVNHIHVYSMNKPEIAEGIMNNLSAILKPTNVS